jgi:hypothetical protein
VVFLGLVVVFALAVAFVVMAMLARSPGYELQLRLPLRGAAASIFTFIVLLGALAGNTRKCMPNLDWGIMLGQVEFEVLVGGFVLPIIVLPAFVVAWRIAPKRDLIGALVLLVYIGAIASFYGAWVHDWLAGVLNAVILCIAGAIGFMYDRFWWMRRYGFIFGILIATVVGVATFASLPYGQANCYL